SSSRAPPRSRRGRPTSSAATTRTTPTSTATTTSTCRRSSARSSGPVPQRLEVPLADGRRAVVAVTDVTDGDLGSDAPPEQLAAARRAVVDLPWTWLHQVHGAHVVVVQRPGEHAGAAADAATTAVSGAVLSVKGADCAPIALV